MTVQAKFYCVSNDGANVSLSAVVAGDDNKSWSQWTPFGQISMNVTNPAALAHFVPGQEYFVTFNAAP
jgi:hypothetical protein